MYFFMHVYLFTRVWTYGMVANELWTYSGGETGGQPSPIDKNNDKGKPKISR